MLRFAIGWLLIWVFYASPVFLASMAVRVVADGGTWPRSVSRAPGPWGDGYLVMEDAADGYLSLYDAWGREVCVPAGGVDGAGDGECPDAMSDRWLSIPLWSLDWVR